MVEGIERVLALDIGSTRVKHAVCTRAGEVVHFGYLPSAPTPDGLLRQVQHLIQAHQGDGFEALALTGRMGPAVVASDDGSVRLSGWPVMHTRTVERLQHLGMENTGYPAGSPRFRGWWIENWSGPNAVRQITPLKDWLIAQLTGARGTDPSNAGALGLLDLRTGSWDESLLRSINVLPGVLPDIESPSTGVGSLQKPWHHGKSVRVYRGAGDGVTGSLGVGLPFEGRAYVNLGTDAVVRMFRATGPVEGADFAYPTGFGGYFSGAIRLGTGPFLEQAAGRFHKGIREPERADLAVEVINEMVVALGGPANFRSLHLLGGGSQVPGIVDRIRDRLGVEVTVADSAVTLQGAAQLIFSKAAPGNAET